MRLYCVRETVVCELRDDFPTGPACRRGYVRDLPWFSALSSDQNGRRGRRIPQFDGSSDRETAWKITKREMHRVLTI